MGRWTWLVLAIAALSCRGEPDGKLAPEYRDLVVPRATVDSPAARARGAVLFSRYCSHCHGAAGDGHGKRVSGLSSMPRDLSDRSWQQRTSDRMLYAAIRDGVRGTAMPSWRSLSEAETWELVAHIRALGGRGSDAPR